MAAGVIARLLRWVLAALFLVAGAVKIWDFSTGGWATPRFFEDISNYHLFEWLTILSRLGLNASGLPWDAAVAIAVYLPWLEVGTGLALFTRRWRPGGWVLCLALLLAFAAVLGSAWGRGLDISCGCFGHENARGALWVPLLRDGCFLASALVSLWLERRGVREESRLAYARQSILLP